MPKFKKAVCLLVCVILITLSGCSGAGGGKLKINVVSPSGTADIVDPQIRSYMKNAENYVVGDYTGTVKVVDDLGNMPVAVNFSWTFEEGEEVESAFVIYSKNKDLSGAERQYVNKIRKNGGKQNVKIFNLETGVKYYWAVETEKDGKTKRSDIFEFETLSGPRILSIGGVKNARDLGGYKTADGKTVKQGMVFRTANLNSLSDYGKSVLLKDLGVKTELDLRNPATEDVYSIIEDKINYINISSKSYAAYWNNPGIAAQAIRVFTLPENYPILFHCAAGADRTGALAFCLNALCGVDEKDLVIDYELTPGRFRKGYRDTKYNYDFPAFMQGVHALEGSTLQEKVYGFFLNKCNLSEMELYNITAMMTGNSAVFTEPPKTAVKADGGKAVFKIDPRSSGEIKSITANGTEYQFTLSSGELTVSAEAGGETHATATFSDGTQMPLVFE